MSDILKQIQALQEQFSNLFEVDGDGLGNPAVDVPPSQNKIKRDRRTKDGKVELVSVEDELFPYDGNKKEQYRQKIIDTINGMIQGTSTLEDLLQIVRQKKAPLKEAVEILEGMINELYPDTVKSALHAHNKKTIELEDKVNKRIGEIFKKHGIKGNTYSAATAEDRQKAAETEKEIKEDPEIKDLHNQQEKRAKKNELYRNAIRKARKSPVEEALEIMEAIINEVSERTKIDAYKKRANQSKLVGDIAKDTAKWHMDRGAYGPAIEVLKKADTAQKKELKHRLRTMLHDKAFDQDAYNKAEKELRDECKTKEDIKETLSLTEEIINEVSVKKWKEAAKNSIEGRKEAASDASDRFGEVVYPFRGEVNDPGHKLGNAWDKAEQRADRAEQLAKNLPDSNKSATKLKQAAKKVVDKRDKDNEEAVDKLQGAIDKFKEKPYDERTGKDYSDLAKVQNEWVDKQKKENQARNLVGKPERRPEKNSEGKHKLKEQGFIDRSNEA